MIQKKLYKIFLAVTVCVSLTACGRKEVEYLSTESENAYKDDINVNGESLKEKIGAEDTWVEEMKVNGRQIYIDAAVDVPETDNVSVVEVKELYFDKEAAEEFNKKFNADKVEAGADELAQQHAEKIIQNAEEVVYNLVPLCYTMEKSGNTYELFYYCDRDKSNSHMTYMVEDMKKVTDADLDNATSYITYQGKNAYGEGENKCGYSREEIEKIAMEFVDNLDIGEFKIIENSELNWNVYFEEEDDEEEFCDGAYVKLVRSIDGVCFNTYDHMSDMVMVMTSDTDGEDMTDEDVDYIITKRDCYMPEVITLYINDFGVFEFVYDYPLVVTEKKADNVRVMSFEQMKQFMTMAFEEKDYSGYSDSVVKYKEIRFMYYWIEDPDNKGVYSLVPVWRIMGNEEDDTRVMINAIDGSYIEAIHPYGMNRD